MQRPARVVVVVPGNEIRLHEYLGRSLASLTNVEVVLDRRAAAVTPPDERRQSHSKNSERKILLCSLVRCPADPPALAAPEAPPSTDEPGQRRTLLGGLRLEHF